MAWLERDSSGSYKIAFRFGDRRFKKSAKTSVPKEAEAARVRVEETIHMIERGRLQMPDTADVATFILSEGKLDGKLVLPRFVTLGSLIDEYLASLLPSSMEANSLYTIKIHFKHLRRILGDRTVVENLGLKDLQGYVHSRCREQSQRKTLIGPTTVKKELASLSGLWSWASAMDRVKKVLPNKGLRYPKTIEKPPFQTWAEIERQIRELRLAVQDQKDFWDRLYLSVAEIAELLDYVLETADQACLHPMFYCAAHTGARRSELIRSQITDFDLVAQSVLIREKKRAKSRSTTRRVPLSPQLCSVMSDWFARHPGGPHTFTLWNSSAPGQPEPLTPNEAQKHFRRVLHGSRWAKLRGWHVLRHSFASICAAAGVDERLIDAWMGHQTEEMRKRYRHLFPDKQRREIQSVFAIG